MCVLCVSNNIQTKGTSVYVHMNVFEGEVDHVSVASEEAMEPDTTTPNL